MHIHHSSSLRPSLTEQSNIRTNTKIMFPTELILFHLKQPTMCLRILLVQNSHNTACAFHACLSSHVIMSCTLAELIVMGMHEYGIDIMKLFDL